MDVLGIRSLQPGLRQFLPGRYFRGKKFMERRIDQPDGDREAGHGAETTLRSPPAAWVEERRARPLLLTTSLRESWSGREPADPWRRTYVRCGRGRYPLRRRGLPIAHPVGCPRWPTLR